MRPMIAKPERKSPKSDFDIGKSNAPSDEDTKFEFSQYGLVPSLTGYDPAIQPDDGQQDSAVEDVNYKALDELLATAGIAQGARPAAAAEIKRVIARAKGAAPLQAQDDLAPPLPDVAPKLWRSVRRGSMSPADFIMKIYGPWIGRLTRSDLKDLDAQLVAAYDWWSWKGNKPPAGFVLPTDFQVRSATRSHRRALKARNLT
jgi:hypothetical protein